MSSPFGLPNAPSTTTGVPDAAHCATTVTSASAGGMPANAFVAGFETIAR